MYRSVTIQQQMANLIHIIYMYQSIDQQSTSYLNDIGIILIIRIYTEGKKKRRVNILGDLILFIRMFFSILIYKDKNTNLINKFSKFH